MKPTPSNFLSAALYICLICGPSILTATAGGAAHPAEGQRPPQAGVAQSPRLVELLPEQLDTVSAGTTVTCNRDGTGCVADQTTSTCVMSTPVIALAGIQFCSRP
jgi:hypothetical protein